MFKRAFYLLSFLLLFVCITGGADSLAQASKGGHTNKNAKPASAASSGGTARKIEGKHMLSLQWILFDDLPYGTAVVSTTKGEMRIKGEQKGKKGDYLKIDGVITNYTPTSFKFNGTVATKVSHINNGEECVRTGDMTFKATGKRKYWRMQEMKNPCDGVTDYVDIYFN